MPIYLYWGEDDFAISQAVELQRQTVLDPQWSTFNYDKILGDQESAIVTGLNQAMTPPFGMGKRLVWLANTNICQQCSEKVLAELERTLPMIADDCVLLLTSAGKPDARLRSTKLLQKHAEIQEFPVIPPWKTEQLVQRVRQVAQILGVKLTSASVELLAQAVGNDTRQLHMELEKLSLFGGTNQPALTPEAVSSLVTATAQNSLQLATAIRQGDVSLALELVGELMQRNEPGLRIVATLIGQFRTWLWVKLMLDTGVRDEKAIAQAAEVANPKRIYFLQQEVRSLSTAKLLQSLPLLLELELSLKQGGEETVTLQTKVIELCQICR